MEKDTDEKNKYHPRIILMKGIPRRKIYQEIVELDNAKMVFVTIILEMHDSPTFVDDLRNIYIPNQKSTIS